MSFCAFLPKLLNMSLTASAAIVLVLILRLFLKKVPKAVSYAFWGIVLFRLLCPVSVGFGFSLFGMLHTPVTESGILTNRIEYVRDNIVHMKYPAVSLPVLGISGALSRALPHGEEQLAADLTIAAYAGISYMRLWGKLLTASLLRDNIYLADGNASPFVMELFRQGSTCRPLWRNGSSLIFAAAAVSLLTNHLQESFLYYRIVRRRVGRYRDFFAAG